MANAWAAGVTVPSVDEGLILRAWEWYLELLQKVPELVMGTYVLMEIMQKAGFLELVTFMLTFSGCIPISRLSE